MVSIKESPLSHYLVCLPRKGLSATEQSHLAMLERISKLCVDSEDRSPGALSMQTDKRYYDFRWLVRNQPVTLFLNAMIGILTADLESLESFLFAMTKRVEQKYPRLADLLFFDAVATAIIHGRLEPFIVIGCGVPLPRPLLRAATAILALWRFIDTIESPTGEFAGTARGFLGTLTADERRAALALYPRHVENILMYCTAEKRPVANARLEKMVNKAGRDKVEALRKEVEADEKEAVSPTA